MPPVFVLVFLGCSQVIYASPSKYLLDSSDEIPNAYGRSVEYTYVYDSSKDAHPVAKVKYGKFIRSQFTTISLNSNAQRNGKVDEKDLQKLLGLDLQHARGIKLWEDEDKSNTEKFHWHPNRYGDHPKFRQPTSNPWRDNFRIKNDDIHFHYENFRNIPEKEKLLKEGLPTDVRDLVDYMAFLMYQQAKKTISSHFPMFPNPFRKHALPRIPFPHIDLTR